MVYAQDRKPEHPNPVPAAQANAANGTPAPSPDAPGAPVVATPKEAELLAASAPVDQLNTIFNPMKFKARLNASWSYGPAYTSLYLNHINAYDNNLANPVQKVRAANTLDLRVALALEDLGSAALLKDTTLAIGVQNLMDKKPPFVNIAQSTNGGGGFDPTQTSPVGRLISLSLDKRF